MFRGESIRAIVKKRSVYSMLLAMVLVLGCVALQGCSSSRNGGSANNSPSAAATSSAQSTQQSAGQAASNSASNEVVVPDVVGMNLSDAKSELKDFKLDYLKLDGSTAHVVVSSNWRVDAQSIEPGTSVAKKTTLVLTLGHIPDEEAAARQAEKEAQQAAERASIDYIDVSASQLVDDLDSNAMVAKETYEGGYYRITGTLSGIDASGKYISLRPEDNPYTWTSIRCDLDDDTVRDAVRHMAEGQIVTLCGKIKSVGEIAGYSVDVYFFQ